MRHLHRIAAMLLLGLLCAWGAAAQTLTDPGSEAEQQATRTVAQRVLGQFDNGLWDASWDLTGDYLRGLVSREHWPATVATLRGGLGAIQSRTPDTIGFSDALLGVPPGRYAVLTFKSQFQHKAVREKVVLVGEDGTWKLAGYYVLHPRPKP